MKDDFKHSKGNAAQSSVRPLRMSAWRTMYFVLAFSVFSFGGNIPAVATHASSATSICVANLKQIEMAKHTWALEHRIEDMDRFPLYRDLFGKDRYIRIPPECPIKGYYSLNPLKAPPACSIHGTVKEHKRVERSEIDVAGIKLIRWCLIGIGLVSLVLILPKSSDPSWIISMRHYLSAALPILMAVLMLIAFKFWLRACDPGNRAIAFVITFGFCLRGMGLPRLWQRIPSLVIISLLLFIPILVMNSVAR